jgi:hypothetical protein
MVAQRQYDASFETDCRGALEEPVRVVELVIAIVVVLLCAPVIVAVSVVAAILILNKKRP